MPTDSPFPDIFSSMPASPKAVNATKPAATHAQRGRKHKQAGQCAGRRSDGGPSASGVGGQRRRQRATPCCCSPPPPQLHVQATGNPRTGQHVAEGQPNTDAAAPARWRRAKPSAARRQPHLPHLPTPMPSPQPPPHALPRPQGASRREGRPRQAGWAWRPTAHAPGAPRPGQGTMPLVEQGWPELGQWPGPSLHPTPSSITEDVSASKAPLAAPHEAAHPAAPIVACHPGRAPVA